jgi:mannose-6-phosphate isomerase-like protein (cupin superfamily)
MKTVIVLALAASALACAARAAEPPKSDEHFSFAGRRPTFQEQYVKPEVVFGAVQTAGRLSLTDEIWEPQFQVPPHLHQKHAETFFVISGRVEWTVAGRTQVLGPGDAVHIPPNTVHSTRVVGGEPLHTLMISEPGGFDESVAYEARFAAEALRDPKLRALLGDVADFHPEPSALK